MGVSSGSQAYHQIPQLGVVLSRTSSSASATHPLHSLWFEVFVCFLFLGLELDPAQYRHKQNNRWLCVSSSGNMYTWGAKPTSCEGGRLGAGQQAVYELPYLTEAKMSQQYQSTAWRRRWGWHNTRHRILRFPFEIRSTTWGGLLKTNRAKLFWLCSTVCMPLLVLSTLAQLSRCEQHFDNSLREILNK